ncbi:MAG: transcriptional regulator, IclR family [Frankiales bacterium]|nr:transcriptional regulator, IclR family [Frankiales bacterium]
MTVESATRNPMLQTLQRAVAVLDLLSQHAPVTVAQLSDKLGLERTIVHRLVRTLESEQLVERDSSGLRLGPRHVLFANSYLGHQGLRQACLPYQVEFLFRTFAGEPWSLALLIRVGGAVTLVSHLVSPTAPLQSLMSVGAVLKAESTAAGRCLLAYEPEEEVVRAIGTEAALQLAPRFAQIRAVGGLDTVLPSERAGAPPDMAALAVCVRGRSGRPIGALTLSGVLLEEHLAPGSPPAGQLRAIAAQVGQVMP